MKLMFVGSTHWSDRYRESPNFPFRAAGEALGYIAAKRGHTLLLGSASERTTDRWVMEGAKRFATEHPNDTVSVVVFYPRRHDRIPFDHEDFRLPNLHIRWSPQLRLEDEAYPHLIPHLAMLDTCDVMIALGGGDNTFVDGCVALYRRIPVFVVPGSGGAAELLFERLEGRYNLQEAEALSGPWTPRSADNIVKLAEDTRPSVDIAIICPLEKERAAVCKALGFSNTQRKPKGSRTYWLGRLAAPEWTEPPYDIVIAQMSAMGTSNSAMTARDVITDWQPRAVLVVGIAAGIGELSIGDVVVGSHVLYCDAGKITPSGPLPEPYMYSADARLFHKAKTIGPWDSEIHAVRPDRTVARPRVHYGVIASGEKVIADEELRDAIVRVHRKVAAIEMEAYGVAVAAFQAAVPVRQLAIRGISDMGDRNKTDDWQEYAAASAASFLRHYLLDRPI